MKRIYITAIPLDSNFSISRYAAEPANYRPQKPVRPYYYPITPVIADTARQGDEIKVIAVRQKNSPHSENLEIFRRELDGLGLPCALTDLTTPENQQRDGLLALFEALTGEMESDACYYADATFGTKTYPLVLSSALHYLAVCSYTLGCINLLPIPGFDGVSLHDMFPHQLKIGFGTVLCGLAANWAVLAVGYALCFLPWWVSFLIVLVLTVMAALLLPSRHSVCWARMLSTFCLLPVMIKSLGFELLAVSLPTAILNIGFCLLLSYLTAPVLLELIFVSYLYQK